MTKVAPLLFYTDFILTVPQRYSEYEYDVLPRKSFSYGFTVKSAGYMPVNTPLKETALFLPRFTVT